MKGTLENRRWTESYHGDLDSEDDGQHGPFLARGPGSSHHVVAVVLCELDSAVVVFLGPSLLGLGCVVGQIEGDTAKVWLLGGRVIRTDGLGLLSVLDGHDEDRSNDGRLMETGWINRRKVATAVSTAMQPSDAQARPGPRKEESRWIKGWVGGGIERDGDDGRWMEIYGRMRRVEVWGWKPGEGRERRGGRWLVLGGSDAREMSFGRQ